MFFNQQDNYFVKYVDFEYNEKMYFQTQLIEMGEFEVVNHNIKKGILADDEVLILTIVKGQGIVFDNVQELALISGDVYFLGSSSNYLISNNNWSLIYILLKGQYAHDLIKGAFKKYDFDIQIRKTFDELYDSINLIAINNSNPLKIAEHLYHFIDKIIQKENTLSNRKTDTIRDSILYIENHYKENVSLEDLAEHVGYSKFYFSRLFKEYLGLSFVNYLHKRRILEAAKLLETTDMPILNILFEVGYEHEANFYKYFNKFLKVSPNDYRIKQIRKRKNY